LLQHHDAKVIGRRVDRGEREVEAPDRDHVVRGDDAVDPEARDRRLLVTSTASPWRAPATATVVVDCPPAAMFGKSKVFRAVKLRFQPKSAKNTPRKNSSHDGVGSRISLLTAMSPRSGTGLIGISSPPASRAARAP
jgi:hypothetical protein